METRRATATPKVTQEKSKYISRVYRKSGNLVNQQLYNATSLEARGIRFSTLSQETREKINNAGSIGHTDQEIIVQGVDLTANEARLVNVICKKLQEESTEVYDPTKPGFYCGNRPPRITKAGNAPQLCLPTRDLVVEYTGKQHPSGPEYDLVNSLIISLCTKQFLLKYNEIDYYEKDTKHTRSIETYAPLIRNAKVREKVEQGGKVVESTETTHIILNPIWQADIATRFILIPYNLDQQLKEAYNGQRVPKGAIDFAEWLLRELSFKKYTAELTEDKLLVMIAKPKVKGRKIAEAKELVNKCLDVMRSIGLLSNFEVCTTLQGITKYKFYLNEGYLRADI